MAVYFPAGSNKNQIPGSSCYKSCHSLLETVSALTGIDLAIYDSKVRMLSETGVKNPFCTALCEGDPEGELCISCRQFHLELFEKAVKSGKLEVEQCEYGLKSFVLPLKDQEKNVILYVAGGQFLSEYNPMKIKAISPGLEVESDRLNELFRSSPVLNDDKLQAVIDKLSDLSSLYLQESRMEEQERKVLNVVNFISEVARKLSGKISLKELLLSIVEKVSTAFEVDKCTIALLDESGQFIETFASNDEYAEEIFGGKVEPGKGATGIVSETGKKVFSYDALNDHRLITSAIEEWGIKSILSLPLKLGERIIGVMHLATQGRKRMFLKRETEFADALASEISLVVEVARLYNVSMKRAEELNRSRNEIKSYFSKIGAALATSLNLKHLLKLIVEMSLSLTHAEAGSIYLIENKKLTRYVAVTLKDLKQAGKGRGEEEEISVYTREHYLEDKFEPHEIKSYLGIPLERKGEVKGLLNILDRSPREFSTEEVELLSIFAGHAALAIDNARLFVIEKKKAREATALYNAAKSIGESVNLDEVLNSSVQQLTNVMGVDRCLILLLDYKKLELYTAAQLGLSEDQKDFFSFYRIPIDEIEDNLWDQLVQGRPVFLASAPKNCPALERFFKVFPTSSCLLAPLFTKNQLIGIIYMDDSRMAYTFSDSQIRLVMTLSLQIAAAIQRATLVEQMENNLDQLKALHQVSTGVTGTLSLSRVFDLVVSKASRLIGAPATSMLAWDEPSREYIMKASLGLLGDLAGEQFHKMISEKAAKRRRYLTYYISSVVKSEDSLIYSTLSSANMGGYVSVPLIARKKVVGVLNCFCKEGDKFDSQEIRLLRSFANQAAIAIENARLYQIIKNKVRELATVFEVGKSITSTLDLDRVLDEITSSVAQVVDGDAASIMLLDEDRQELKIIKTLGLGKYHQGETIKVGTGIAGIAAKVGRPMILHDEESSASPYKFPERVKWDNLRTIISVPLKVRDKIIGLVNIYKKAVYHFSPSEINLLTTIANQAAVAIENANLYNEQYNIAQIIQRNLMPEKEIKQPGIDIGFIYIPSQTLSGDYFDILSLDEKQFGLVIADVSGKGTEAAIYNARGKYILRAYAMAYYSPSKILTFMNQLIEEETASDRFISVLYIDLDLKQMEITVSSAGHEPLIVWDDSEKEVRIIKSSNLPVGVFPDTAYDEKVYQVGAGDILLLYTDGITEGRSREGDFFGIERLVNIVKENFHLSSQALANKIYTKVQKFTRRRITDDFSLLVVRL